MECFLHARWQGSAVHSALFYYYYFIEGFCFSHCRTQLPGEGLVSLQTALPMFALKLFPLCKHFFVAGCFFFRVVCPRCPFGGRFPCDQTIFLGRTLCHPGAPFLSRSSLRAATSRGIPSPAAGDRQGPHHRSRPPVAPGHGLPLRQGNRPEGVRPVPVEVCGLFTVC